MNQRKKIYYSVIIPSYRLDIKNQEDLVEEIGKTYGYDNVPACLPLLQQKEIFIDKNQFYRDLIRQKLSNLGYKEIITYSLISKEEDSDNCFFSEGGKVYKLLSPKSENYVCYRRSLLPSHLKTIAYNLMRQNENLFFFEISKVYSLTSESVREEEILALSGTGKVISNSVHRLENDYDFFWLKGVIEGLFIALNINDRISFVPSQVKKLHPYQGADILLNQKKIGFAGQIHPQTRKSYQISQPVFGAQISLSRLFFFITKDNRWSYQIVSPFPKIEQDLSFYLVEDILANKVTEIIKKNGNSLLKEVRIFDAYQSKEDKENQKKSLTFRLTFQSQEKTLQKPEVDKIIQKIIEQVQILLDAKLKV
jgi:phenylalanyl-tRNA synthetase beta chain